MSKVKITIRDLKGGELVAVKDFDSVPRQGDCVTFNKFRMIKVKSVEFKENGTTIFI